MEQALLLQQAHSHAARSTPTLAATAPCASRRRPTGRRTRPRRPFPDAPVAPPSSPPDAPHERLRDEDLLHLPLLPRLSAAAILRCSSDAAPIELLCNQQDLRLHLPRPPPVVRVPSSLSGRGRATPRAPATPPRPSSFTCTPSTLAPTTRKAQHAVPRQLLQRLAAHRRHGHEPRRHSLR